MNHVALRRDAVPSYLRFQPADEPVEFGNGLRARLESVGRISSDESMTLRLALERKLLAALPQLATVRGGPVLRRRVPHVPFATLAFQANLLAAEPLEQALDEAERRNEPVGRVLTRSGLLSERQVDRLLAEQRGLAYVHVGEMELDERLTGVLPELVAVVVNAIPLGYLHQAPVIAVSDPTDDEGLERISVETGETVTFVVASRDDVAVAVRRLYGPAEAVAA